jgi:hypothetical protein
MRTCGVPSAGRTRDLPVPVQRASAHARFSDHAGPNEDSRSAFARVAFRSFENVGAQKDEIFAAQWLAYALPCRRFADALADASARLGANADRYSFIAADFHRLLLAGLSRRTESLSLNLTPRHEARRALSLLSGLLLLDALLSFVGRGPIDRRKSSREPAPETFPGERIKVMISRHFLPAGGRSELKCQSNYQLQSQS